VYGGWRASARATCQRLREGSGPRHRVAPDEAERPPDRADAAGQERAGLSLRGFGPSYGQCSVH
jgi:hypothetical protein